ncbi:putative ribonuclease H-like domain-containing protein [Tanacetum coccineum]
MKISNGGFVAFGSDPKGGKITGKGKIKTANLDFDDVYFVDELKFNLFSVSQMCDKKNSVLFTESECLILSPSFKLLDESQVVLRAPRKDGVYSLDLKNIVPSGGITCLYANATADESKLWHRRLGHVNFKNINKLVKGHLVRGLPSKVFVNDHTCVACKKGKQHKASCKAKLDRIIRKPLELLHMDLFGPVSIESINKKRYCLVVTDDFSRFSWVFFLATKDETSEILCNLIIGLEKQLNHNVKIIRCDNGTEFKNHAMNEFCAKKGIKREFSVARTPQQNGVAERKNRTLIEAARTMLADSLLPIPFWAEAVNTACYVLNRVLVTKPQNKTPYELLIGKSPSISFMRPFGCPLTILNTLDSLGKFDGKSDEGYLLGYSTSSKAFRVYNKRTKRVEENLHINFLEDQPNVAGTGPNWMFDLDFLTNSMNYIPVSVENQVNVDAGTQDSYVAGSSGKDKGPTQEYILLPLQPHRTRIPIEDVAPVAHETLSESSPKENDVQDSEDAEQKAKAKRSKPMTQAQQREYMSTFIKNQSSWKLSQLKKLSFEELKTEFEKLMKSIESFVPMETEARVKRHGLQLEQETSKKQKIDIEDASITNEKGEVVKEEEAEVLVKKTGMRRKQKARKGINIAKTAQDEFNNEREAFMKDKVKDASSESEIGVDAIPTATKPPTIVNWKIISQSSQKAAYQIIRKDDSDKIYMSFGAILKDFSRDDLIELYRLVIKKYGENRPEEMYDRVLWGDLKTMFDPPLSDDAIWSLPLQQKIINWRYYPTCAVHCLTLDASTIYMLADRKYPLSKDACQVMLKMKLLDGTMDEVCYQLLKMIEKQAGIRK